MSPFQITDNKQVAALYSKSSEPFIEQPPCEMRKSPRTAQKHFQVYLISTTPLEMISERSSEPRIVLKKESLVITVKSPARRTSIGSGCGIRQLPGLGIGRS